MKHWETTDPEWGRILHLSDGKTEVSAALDFGIRVVGLSAAGEPNLFYRQPEDDQEYRTPKGWRLYGGHRLWTAPEGDWSYYPDNAPVSWELSEEGVSLEQADPWLRITKRLTLAFQPDGWIRVEHRVSNTDVKPISCGVWGVSTLSAGGSMEVSLPPAGEDDYAPGRMVQLWGKTSLSDPRLRMEGDRLLLQQTPSDAFFKIGLYTGRGEAVYRNHGQRFTCRFGSGEAPYPDGGCNFEAFLSSTMMELETLGGLCTLLPGEERTHTEFWQVEPEDSERTKSNEDHINV